MSHLLGHSTAESSSASRDACGERYAADNPNSSILVYTPGRPLSSSAWSCFGSHGCLSLCAWCAAPASSLLVPVIKLLRWPNNMLCEPTFCLKSAIDMLSNGFDFNGWSTCLQGLMPLSPAEGCVHDCFCKCVNHRWMGGSLLHSCPSYG